MKKGNLYFVALPIAIFVGLFLTIGALQATAEEKAVSSLKELGEAFVEISEKVTPAVVNISSTKKVSGGAMEHPFKDGPFPGLPEEFFKRFFGPHHGKGFKQRGMGSGVIVSEDGTILTNAHVVKDADEIKVTMANKRTLDAKVVGIDPESDIAVIKVDAKGLSTAELGNSDELRVGEVVLAIGNPFGLNQTVTSGIVSAKGRTNVGIIEYEDFIQTDAAINPGNSGGPLVNIRGEVIGINTAIASRSGGYQGIGFAIPSNSVKLIMEDLLKEGRVRRGLLGVNIQNLNSSLAKSFGRKDAAGALVSQVVDDSPAEKAGIKSGDIITKFDGQKVKDASHLKNVVGRVRPGTKSTVTVFRKGETKQLDVTIGERDPKKMAALRASDAEDAMETDLGVEVEDVPTAIAKRLGLKADEGVRVTKVRPDGIGGKLGLRPGDVILEVNDAPVSDVSSLRDAVAAAEKDETIRVKVQRRKARIYLAAPVG